MKNGDTDILTPKDVCEILKIGRTKLYAMVSSGEIASFKVGKSIRIPRDKLKEYISNRINP